MNALLLALIIFNQTDTILIKELKISLEDAGENRINLEQAVKEVNPLWKDDIIWLITKMPHLDRLEMKTEIIVENVEFARKAFAKWALPDSLFREYVLPYRFSEEAVLAWRKKFYANFQAYASGASEKTAQKINRVIAKEFTLVDKKEFYGPEPSPLHLLRLKTGTKEQAGILLAAALRSLGIPTRFVRCPLLGEEKGGASWIEFFNGKAWLPVYPLHPEAFGNFDFYEKDKPHNLSVVIASSAFKQRIATGNYTAVGYLKLNFISKGLSVDSFEHYNISIFNDGAHQPLDDLLWYSENPYILTLGDGEYLFEVGTRAKGGNPYVQIIPVTIVPTETIMQTVNLDMPLKDLKREEFLARKLDSIPEISFHNLERKIFSLKELAKKPRVLFYFFDPRTEPSKRMIGLVRKFTEQNKILVYDICLDSLTPSVDSGTATDHVLSGDSSQVKTKLFIKAMPSTMLFIDGQLIYWDEGYNLNIRNELDEILRRQ